MLYRTVKEHKKLGNRKEAGEFKRKYKERLRLRKKLTSTQKRVRTINQKIKLVHLSKNLSSDQKRIKIDKLLQKRSNILKKLIERIK